MKASLSRGIGHGFTIADVQVADPVGQEVLVDVRASGLCATDLSIVSHDTGLGYPFPAVLGHEISGVALEVGPAVRGVRGGDHVVGSLIQYCGACRACLAGRQFECSDTGATVQHEGGSRLSADGAAVYQGSGLGGFAEMALVHENQLAVIPDDVPFPQASLLGCGTITGAGAVINTAKVRPGESVVVIGTGGVGLNAISGALIAGATTIVAVDIVDAKLDLARRFGATHTVNSASVDVVPAVQEITHGGADHVFEVIGLPATQRTAIELAGINGGVYLIGMAPMGTTIDLDTSMMMLFMHRRVQGVSMGSTNHKRDIPMYAELYRQGRLNLDDLITQEIALDGIDAAYRQLTNGETIRSVITRF